MYVCMYVKLADTTSPRQVIEANFANFALKCNQLVTWATRVGLGQIADPEYPLFGAGANIVHLSLMVPIEL